MERPSTIFQHIDILPVEHVLEGVATCMEDMSTRRRLDHNQLDSHDGIYRGRETAAMSAQRNAPGPASTTSMNSMTSRWTLRSKPPHSVLARLACIILALSVLATPTSAVLINFDNCLSLDWQKITPLYLQWVPLYMDAVFNTTDASHRLNVTVWGNVTGSLPLVVLPDGNSSEWTDGNFTDGKIVDVPDPDGNNVATTLSNKVNVLTYQPFSQLYNFCDELINGTCPLGPVFYPANA